MNCFNLLCQVELLYKTTAEDNTQNLLDIVRQSSSMKDFLSDDSIHLSVSPTTMTRSEQSLHLDLSFDIDGVVVQLEELSGLKLRVPYLTFPKPSKVSVHPVFHLLKKHVKPHVYSGSGFRCFQLSRGLTIATPQVGVFVKLIDCSFPNFAFVRLYAE